ncbi:M24 family metallopeptidase [Fictibacillus sp. FJAT-27399]|uniref:M24 family metallopeptidase n=1 Tax=Fictibacillus sp. FJAT-27399 TaxID=1729689 RepID=UPI001F4660B4|nr:Xaa-Pro peptidase family protein [Fictibacillus sp. FJAT-27399]
MVERLKEKGLDAVVIVPGANMSYFTGISLKQTERLILTVITTNGDLFFIVPQVEKSKFEMEGSGLVFWYTDEQGATKALTEFLSKSGTLEKVGIEYGRMTVKELKAVESLDPITIDDISDLVDSLRLYKDEQEIDMCKKAVNIVEESLHNTLPFIKPGVKETEIAARLEYEMRKRGSQATPFETIVASGYRGALPHGRASEKQIQNGELVVLDFGAVFQGYVADITRTVAVGEISNEFKEIYDIVKEAQQAAINAAKAGITSHEVDEAARKVIRHKGYGEFFTHRTGHGIGLNGHEQPYIMQTNQLVLKPGMTFTIEPGIYLPHKGGVRIEDNIVINNHGVTNLMTYTKELIILNGECSRVES